MTAEPSMKHSDCGSVRLQFKTETPVLIPSGAPLPEDWTEHWSKTKSRQYYRNKYALLRLQPKSVYGMRVL